MTKHHLSLLIITLLVSALLLGAVYFLPLTKEYRLLASNDLTLESYSLQPGHIIKQTFVNNSPQQTGVRIFTAVPALSDQQLLLQIFDENNRLLATGQFSDQSYLASNDSIVLDYSFPWLTTKPDESLTLSISLTTGNQLPLNISAHNTYRDGALYFDDIKQPGDLALATIHPHTLGTSARVGAIVGIAFFISAAFIITFLTPLYQWWAAAALLVIVTPLSLLGFWFSAGDLGIADWDLYFSYHEVIRRTILVFHTFPFWNPWLCGGTAGLADPEFPLFTFTFLLELIFGIRTGFPLAIYLSVATTAVGLLLLAKRLRLSLLPALLASLAGTFGSVTILEIVEGHPNVFAAMWIPWIFWAWYNAYALNPKHQTQSPQQISKDKTSKTHPFEISIFEILNLFRISHRHQAGSRPRRDNLRFRIWTIVCGIFLALTFYAGGIYLLMYTALAFIFITFLVGQPRAAILTTAIAGLWGLGLAALKLIPVLLWLNNYPDKSYASSAFTLPFLSQILFGRHLHGSNIIFAQNSGWHEYGAYIGYFVFALAILGASKLSKDRIVRALVIAAITATLLSSVGPALKPYFDVLPFLPRSNVSRFILFAIIPISLLAGYGLQSLLNTLSSLKHQQSNIKLLSTLIALLLIAFVSIDLFSLSSQLSNQAFVLPKVTNPPAPAPYPIAYTAQRFDQFGNSSRTTRSYAAILQGYGTLTYCSVLGPDPMVRTIHDEVDNGLILSQPTPKSINLTSWKPNQAVFNLTVSEPTKLILNTNFAPGWQAQSNTNSTTNKLAVFGDSGRVAVNILPGEQTVSFFYRTAGFVPGLIITLLTISLIAVSVYSLKKNKLP